MPNARGVAPMRCWLPAVLALAASAAPDGPTAVHGLETDQFFAWGRQLEDVTGPVNAWVNLELERLIDDLNRDGSVQPCQKVRYRFFRRHRMLFFDGFETWSVNSPLVSRSPSGPEEMRDYEQNHLYGGTSKLLDTGRWMPSSPTVEVDGVRLGTDKLTHFLGTAWYYHRWYRKAIARGVEPAAAVDRVVLRGLRHEITILGRAVSGVLSLADLEANYQGMWFYEHLCAGGDPNIVREDGVWRLRKPFDLRDYVTPEWDESWQPNIYLRRKWEKVKRRMLGYCPLLNHPQVAERRRAYAERDRVTETEKLIEEMVDARKLPDPSGFGIDVVCREAAD